MSESTLLIPHTTRRIGHPHSLMGEKMGVHDLLEKVISMFAPSARTPVTMSEDGSGSVPPISCRGFSFK